MAARDPLPLLPPRYGVAAPRAQAADDMPRTIGKYRVKARLGEGATSEVFLAHDPFRDRDVAIKRVRRSLMDDARETHFQQRFFEAEAALVGKGRLVIRPSGTEPVIRVMAEGENRDLVEQIVDDVIDALSKSAA